MGGIELSYQAKQQARKYTELLKEEEKRKLIEATHDTMEQSLFKGHSILQETVDPTRKDEYERRVAEILVGRRDFDRIGMDCRKLIDIMCLREALTPRAFCMLRSYVVIMEMHDKQERIKKRKKDNIKYAALAAKVAGVPFGYLMEYLGEMAEILDKVTSSDGKILYDFGPDILDAFFQDNEHYYSYKEFKEQFYAYFSKEKNRLGDQFYDRYIDSSLEEGPKLADAIE